LEWEGYLGRCMSWPQAAEYKMITNEHIDHVRFRATEWSNWIILSSMSLCLLAALQMNTLRMPSVLLLLIDSY
jgi:hypothetical protein